MRLDDHIKGKPSELDGWIDKNLLKKYTNSHFWFISFSLRILSVAVDGECVQAPTTINASPTIFFFFFGYELWLSFSFYWSPFCLKWTWWKFVWVSVRFAGWLNGWMDDWLTGYYCCIYIDLVIEHFETWLTFSGNQGVTNGIWNVLLYECNVSNDSGETAPSIENTPRENWLHTEMKEREKNDIKRKLV